VSIPAEIAVTLLGLVDSLIQLYMFIIMFAVVISWVHADPYNPIVRFVRQVTDPLIAPIRRRLWRMSARLGLDFSPMIAMAILLVVQIVIRRLKYAAAGL
jgi:YggT family protein